jgi:Glycosyl transferase family 2
VAVTVGVGITTRNRPDILATCLEHVRKHTPGARIVVVDDASDVPVPGADHRFAENAGIARAKNKCLELLADCEHIFLFDDDCWPVADGWYEPYVNSAEPHLMYIFEVFHESANSSVQLKDTKVLYADSRHVAYSHPRGCMLYCDRRVLDVAGGMDAAFGMWGFEHGDWSNRIHAFGLTTFRFPDVAGSSALIHSMDEYGADAHLSTVDGTDRRACLKRNSALYKSHWNAPIRCEFRETPLSGSRDIVLTSYLSGVVDPQRGVTWGPDPGATDPLRQSLGGRELIVFSDSIPGVSVEPGLNPYFARWMHVYRYLRDHEDVRYAFCVDATDALMLHDPFPHMRPGALYCGSEPATLSLPWMVRNHPTYAAWLRRNASRPLLNCGLVGGDRATVMRLAHDVLREYMDAMTNGHDMPFDMGAFNFAAYEGGYEIVTGPLVHTRFKAYEAESDAWWKHK